MAKSNATKGTIIEHITRILHLLDVVMKPLMLVINGFKLKDLQNTHFWHIQRQLSVLPPESQRISIRGNDTSPFTNKHLGLFHIQLIGGWRHYVVLEVPAFEHHWHIGWVVSTHKKPERVSEIHRLSVRSHAVRMLSGPRGTNTEFFAIDDFGKTLPIRKIGEGMLGDGQFSDVPLL